jgi:hypothetical protein
MTDYDSEIPASSFIRIGQSLEMPGEIDVKLKEVPRHKKITDLFKKNVETDVYSHVEDPRWIFLNAPENQDKYYYVRRGGPNQILPARCVDCGLPPVDNILEPLGKFERVELIDTRSNLRDNYRHYWIWFENSENTSQRVSENDQLYYTDEPPAAGSVPLTINNIPPVSTVSKGGKKTKKYRKKPKKNKTIRNIKNKKQKVKSKK